MAKNRWPDQYDMIMIMIIMDGTKIKKDGENIVERCDQHYLIDLSNGTVFNFKWKIQLNERERYNGKSYYY